MLGGKKGVTGKQVPNTIKVSGSGMSENFEKYPAFVEYNMPSSTARKRLDQRHKSTRRQREVSSDSHSRMDSSRSRLQLRVAEDEKSTRQSSGLRSKRRTVATGIDQSESSRIKFGQSKLIPSRVNKEELQQDSISKDTKTCTHLKNTSSKNQTSKLGALQMLKKKKSTLKRVIEMADGSHLQRSAYPTLNNHSLESSAGGILHSHSTFFRPDAKRVRGDLHVSREYDLHTSKLMSKIKAKHGDCQTSKGQTSSSVSSTSRCTSNARKHTSDDEKSEEPRLKGKSFVHRGEPVDYSGFNLKAIFEKTRKALEQSSKLRKTVAKLESDVKPKKTMLVKNKRSGDGATHVATSQANIMAASNLLAKVKPVVWPVPASLLAAAPKQMVSKMMQQAAKQSTKKKKTASKDTAKRGSSKEKEKSAGRSKSRNKERTLKGSFGDSTRRSKERTSKKMSTDTPDQPKTKVHTAEKPTRVQQSSENPNRTNRDENIMVIGDSDDMNPTFRKILTTKMKMINQKNRIIEESASKIQKHWRIYKSRTIRRESNGSSTLVRKDKSDEQEEGEQEEPVCMKTSSKDSDSEKIQYYASIDRQEIEKRFQRFTEENEKKLQSFLKSLEKIKPELDGHSSFIEKFNQYKHKAEMCIKLLKQDKESEIEASNEYRLEKIVSEKEATGKLSYLNLKTEIDFKEAQSEVGISQYLSDIVGPFGNFSSSNPQFLMSSGCQNAFAVPDINIDPIKIDVQYQDRTSEVLPEASISPSEVKKTIKPVRLLNEAYSKVQGNGQQVVPQLQMQSPFKVRKQQRIIDEPFPHSSNEKPKFPNLLTSQILHQSIEKTRRNGDSIGKNESSPLVNMGSVQKSPRESRLVISTQERVTYIHSDRLQSNSSKQTPKSRLLDIDLIHGQSNRSNMSRGTPEREKASSESKKTEKRARECLGQINVERISMDDSRITPSICASSIGQSPKEPVEICLPTKRVWEADLNQTDNKRHQRGGFQDNSDSSGEQIFNLEADVQNLSPNTEEKTTKFNIHSNTSKSINIKELGGSLNSESQNELALSSEQLTSGKKKEVLLSDINSSKKAMEVYQSPNTDIKVVSEQNVSTPEALKSSVMPFNGIYDDPQEEIGIIDEQLRQEQYDEKLSPINKDQEIQKEVAFASASDKAEIITSFILENLIIESISEDFCIKKFVTILGPQARHLETSSFMEYIDTLYSEIYKVEGSLHNVKRKLNSPIGHSDLQKLLLASPLLSEADQELVGVFDYEPVLDIKLYISLEESFRENLYKTRNLDGFEMEREHILHKMIFDSLNECLDYKRKGGIAGLGLKFSRKYRAESDFDDQATAKTLQSAKNQVVDWARSKCGTMMEKESTLSYLSDQEGLELMREKVMNKHLNEYVRLA